MSDILDRALIGPVLILELIDEYTLYCYYTEIDDLLPRTNYYSPIRDEGVPSFSFWEISNSNTEYLWKDSGKSDLSGNIFKLIKILFDYKNYEQVYRRIDEDFELGLYNDQVTTPNTKVVKYTKKFKDSIAIRVRSIPFTEEDDKYWGQFGISKQTLSKYNTTRIDHIWYNETQLYPNYVRDLCYAYRLNRYYQIYKPYAEKKEKFRNNLPEHYVFGYKQLPKTGEILIIDKSMKDIMFCNEIGFPAVAGKSETTMIPDAIMQDLLKRFTTIYIMLDNDNAGRTQTEKYLASYPSLIPIFLEQAKDKTDLCKVIGVEEAKNHIKTLIK